MALQTYAGTFAAKTTTGAQVITGVGFQPKAIIFFGTPQSATGYITTASLVVGFAVSSTQRASVSAAIAPGPNSQRTQINTAAIRLQKSGATQGTFSYTADLTSMDSDGFTLNFTTTDASGAIINYLALGGSDITNAFVGSYLLTPGITTQAITGVGFQPDCILTIHEQTGSLPPAAGSSNHGVLGIGAAAGTLNQGASVIRDNNSASPNTLDSTYQKTTQMVLGIATGTDTSVSELALKSFDADGFTMNTPTVESGDYIHYLCLKGGKYAVLNDTQRTSIGTQATTGALFQPTGMLLFGNNLVAATTIGHGGLSIGATDGTRSNANWIGASNNVVGGSALDASSVVASKVIRHATPASTTNAEASLSSFDAAGFTLNWTTADTTARQFIAVLFGSNVTVGSSNPSPRKDRMHRRTGALRAPVGASPPVLSVTVTGTNVQGQTLTATIG